MTAKIAIIGAGISGLTLAQNLMSQAEVTVFEKARGVGGRMSTRYADPFYFDHGTQFFTARSKAFQQFLRPLQDAGIVQEWQGKVITFAPHQKKTKRLWFEPHWVASPNMNSLCKKMAEGLNITVNTEVSPLTARQPDGWHLTDKEGNALGMFDWVISTAPPAQTIRLFGAHLPDDSLMHHAQMHGCYALMLGFHHPWQQPWIAAKLQDNPLQWIAVNSSKPGRNQQLTCLVAHSCHRWAEDHMDDEIAEAQKMLLAHLHEATGIDGTKADYISTHRWKYATVAEAEERGAYYDPHRKLASVSDWSTASRIEDCWLNAVNLAKQINLALH